MFCPNLTVAELWKVGVNGWSQQRSGSNLPLDLTPSKHCTNPLKGKTLNAFFGYFPGYVMKTERAEVDGFEANTLRYVG